MSTVRTTEPVEKAGLNQITATIILRRSMFIGNWGLGCLSRPMKHAWLMS